MKKTVIFVCVFVFALSLSLANAQDRELQGLQEVLKARNATWTAGETTLTRMVPAERAKLLGLLPGVYDPARVPALTTISTPVRADRYETPHTAIRDQGQCGSCYAHGAIASYEGWRLIQGKTTDLSEQWFMMQAKKIGPYGGCEGWWLDTSMNLLKDNGVANESDCKYLAYEAECTSGSPVHKIGAWASTVDKATIQAALEKSGPVYVGFAVYNDFFNYTSGYYAYSSGGLAGYHAVAVVGFDDQGFKVKNSWGTGWGENAISGFSTAR